jgi:drug/metabolite transporter (DMT)-like permease
MDTQRKGFPPHIAMFGCVLCWSTSGLFITFIDWHPMVISCVRSAAAALFMAAVHKGIFVSGAFLYRGPRIFGVSALVLGAVASGATKMLYVAANKLTSPANAILLQHSAPVWAALFAGFLTGEKLSTSQRVAAVLGTAGIVIFMVDGLHSGMVLGDSIALLSGITFALSMTALRMQKDGSPGLALFFSHLIPMVLGIPFLIIEPPRLTVESIGAVLFLGFVQIGGASLLYAYAIKRLPSINVMLIAQTEPLLNPAWVFLFTGEAPTIYGLCGGAVIIGAALLGNLRKSR